MGGGHEFGDGFAVGLAGDGDDGFLGVLVDEEFLEDGLVEQASAVVGGLAVELVGVAEQVELGLHDGCAFVEAVVGLVQAFLDVAFLCLQAGQAGADFAAGQVSVGGEVEEVFFVPVDGGEFGGELVVEQLPAGGGLAQDVLDAGTDAGDEVVGQFLGRPVLGDGVLDLLDGQVGEVAGAFLAAQADEVVVLLAVLTGGAGEDEPSARASPTSTPPSLWSPARPTTAAAPADTTGSSTHPWTSSTSP